MKEMMDNFEVKSNLIYQTEEVEVPENLKIAGFKGKAFVKVEKAADGKFHVIPQVDFSEGIDPLDLMPTTEVCDDEEKAKEAAEKLISELENWNEIG
jgi:hypothetical protein